MVKNISLVKLGKIHFFSFIIVFYIDEAKKLWFHNVTFLFTRKYKCWNKYSLIKQEEKNK